MQLTEGQIFDTSDFAKTPLPVAEYENCTFNHCNFFDCDISGIIFIDCTFNSCNLSMCKLEKTALRDIIFTDCKLLGVHFEDANPLGLLIRFKNCAMHSSSFHGAKIRHTIFDNCILHEADFTACDATGASFIACDLFNAHFENTVLDKADFSTAFQYTINPLNNSIRKASFAYPDVTSLLQTFDIIIKS
ncbi:MAG: pentapeptide repeat-containing protein [Bacteroidetes bacterium]|nr:pentapeptide repeat-containing protein [Bacteroidota bacterium]